MKRSPKSRKSCTASAMAKSPFRRRPLVCCSFPLLAVLGICAVAASRLLKVSQFESGCPSSTQPASETTAENNEEIHQVLNRLLAVETRYYVYNDSRFKPLPYFFGNFAIRGRYGGFAQMELDLIQALEQHSLRTANPDEADLFVIPLSLSNHIINRKEGNGSIGSVFEAVYEQPAFQQQKPHLLLLQMPNLFDQEHAKLFSKPHYRIFQQLSKLWNNTIVAKVFDQDGCQEILNADADDSRIGDFLPVVQSGAKRTSRSSFSLGQMAPNSFPYVPASYEHKFRTANSVEIFYRSRLRESAFNSTPFRHAMLNESVYRKFPNSSIGFDVSAEQWMSEFQSARFCMVIRGDTPTSRALLRAIKVGCIPVVVSNLYPTYATTLKSSIPMHKYAVLLDEATFLADPVATLSHTLNNLDNISSKIQWLALAQRIMIPDHPTSLFVPALLYEARKAQEYGAQFPDKMPRRRGRVRVPILDT